MKLPKKERQGNKKDRERKKGSRKGRKKGCMEG
jgi:hypothetical protein